MSDLRAAAERWRSGKLPPHPHIDSGANTACVLAEAACDMILGDRERDDISLAAELVRRANSLEGMTPAEIETLGDLMRTASGLLRSQGKLLRGRTE